MKSIIPIETERLILDKFKISDRDNHFGILDSREYQLYNCSNYEPSTEEQKNEMFQFLLEQNYGEKKVRFVMAIRLKDSGVFIGHMGLKNGKLEKDGSIELYFGLSKKFWNKGYGTEALKATISFCFDKIEIHRIFAGCDIDNLASASIVETAGMIRESQWRKDRFRYG